MSDPFPDQPPRRPRRHARCDLHDVATCAGWCPHCAGDHRAGLHTCQGHLPIRRQEAHDHHIPEHPHTCACCYPLPEQDDTTGKGTR